MSYEFMLPREVKLITDSKITTLQIIVGAHSSGMTAVLDSSGDS